GDACVFHRPTNGPQDVVRAIEGAAAGAVSQLLHGVVSRGQLPDAVERVLARRAGAYAALGAQIGLIGKGAHQTAREHRVYREIGIVQRVFRALYLGPERPLAARDVLRVRGTEADGKGEAAGDPDQVLASRNVSQSMSDCFEGAELPQRAVHRIEVR